MQGFHRPIYTPSLEGVTLASDLQVATDLRNTWETIFFQYEVGCLHSRLHELRHHSKTPCSTCLIKSACTSLCNPAMAGPGRVHAC